MHTKIYIRANLTKPKAIMRQIIWEKELQQKKYVRHN